MPSLLALKEGLIGNQLCDEKALAYSLIPEWQADSRALRLFQSGWVIHDAVMYEKSYFQQRITGGFVQVTHINDRRAEGSTSAKRS